jgi:hypothetical protein
MAEFGKPGEPQMLLPRISQEALARIIGATRARVSFFMNRFRKLGFLDYKPLAVAMGRVEWARKDIYPAVEAVGMW